MQFKFYLLTQMCLRVVHSTKLGDFDQYIDDAPFW